MSADVIFTVILIVEPHSTLLSKILRWATWKGAVRTIRLYLLSYLSSNHNVFPLLAISVEDADWIRYIKTR